MLNAKYLSPGEQQHETFNNSVLKKVLVQYDYRDLDGELFSTVKKTLTECMDAKDAWIKNKDYTREAANITEMDIDKEAAFKPLIDFIGMRHIDDFMFMHLDTKSGPSHIYAYKHCMTRKYLYLDAEGNFYSYDPTGFEKITKKEAIAHITL